MTLFDAQINKLYKIKELKIQNDAYRRLTEMGFTRGTKISVTSTAPLGGVILASLRGTLIAIRRDIAKSIEIEACYGA